MRRHLPIGVLLGASAVLATTSVAILGSTGSANADTITRSGAVAVDSLPGSQPISIAQFDPTLGDLTSITVIAHLTGGVDAQVRNLTATARSTTVTFSASGQFAGPGAVQLQVLLAASSSQTLGAGASSTFSLSDADQSSTVVNDPTTLAAFVGTGSVTFNLNGSVQVNVVGPARWQTSGTSHAEASIEVQYEYNRPTTTTSTSTTTTSTTTTTMPTTTSTSTTSTSTSTTSTSTTSTTTTTTPPSTCPAPIQITDWSYDVNDSPNWTPHTYLDGRFTITKLYFENLPSNRWPTAFDFTSTVPVTYVAVRSHEVDGTALPAHEYFFDPAVTSGTHLAPNSPDPDGKFGRVKDIWVCLGPGSSTTTTTTPPSPKPCRSPILIQDWSYDVNNSPNWTPQTYLDGRFTITKLYFENLPDKRWPTAFDFTSTVPVTYVAVQSHVDNGQQTPPNEYVFSPSVTSGTHLNPTNPDPDGYKGRVKDIWVCLGKRSKKAASLDTTSTTTSATADAAPSPVGPATEAPTSPPPTDIDSTEPDTSGGETSTSTSTTATTVSVTETATTTSTVAP